MCSEVGDHHQNGVSEAHIKKILNSSRAFLLHAKKRWSAANNAVLWTFALRTAVDFHNSLDLNEDEKFPQELSSGGDNAHFKYFHAWGCAVFALDHRNQ